MSKEYSYFFSCQELDEEVDTTVVSARELRS